MSGKLIIFSAPSGAGKSTLVHHLLKENLQLEFSVSATSRKPRGNEQHGVDYYFSALPNFVKELPIMNSSNTKKFIPICFTERCVRKSTEYRPKEIILF